MVDATPAAGGSTRPLSRGLRYYAHTAYATFPALATLPFPRRVCARCPRVTSGRLEATATTPGSRQVSGSRRVRRASRGGVPSPAAEPLVSVDPHGGPGPKPEHPLERAADRRAARAGQEKRETAAPTSSFFSDAALGRGRSPPRSLTSHSCSGSGGSPTHSWPPRPTSPSSAPSAARGRSQPRSSTSAPSSRSEALPTHAWPPASLSAWPCHTSSEGHAQ